MPAIDAPDPAAQHPLLVTTEWLSQHLDDPRLVLVDMAEPAAYERAHIRGAVGVPHPWLKGGTVGANNLEVMPAADLQALARRQGISADSVVILYDDHLNRAAARGWWVLERYGFEGARVVDGGLHAWIAEGSPVTQEVPAPEPGTFVARPVDELTCSLQDMRDAMHPTAGVQIWDVRTEVEWEGRSTNNQRAGHIPGAVHFEWRNFIDNTPSHHFVPLSEARRLLEAAGINPEAVTVTY
ncbi:MAG: sulfurtransferase [Dehalococcoidia bacterium]|nr:sulfurtransferase [Dehalococcoidia bacterium]